MIDYSLTCVNNSALIGRFAIFRKQPPLTKPGNDFSLTWRSHAAPPHSRVVFNWGAERQAAYWVAFGDFEAGQGLDADTLAGAQEVACDEATTALTATLGPDNRITIS